MNKNVLRLSAIVILIALGLSLVYYSTDGQIRRSIFSDIKANKVGDILTIIINEETTSLNRSDASTSKQNQMSVDNTAGAGILDFIPGFKVAYQLVEFFPLFVIGQSGPDPFLHFGEFHRPGRFLVGNLYDVISELRLHRRA